MARRQIMDPPPASGGDGESAEIADHDDDGAGKRSHLSAGMTSMRGEARLAHWRTHRSRPGADRDSFAELGGAVRNDCQDPRLRPAGESGEILADRSAHQGQLTYVPAKLGNECRTI